MWFEEGYIKQFKIKLDIRNTCVRFKKLNQIL